MKISIHFVGFVSMIFVFLLATYSIVRGMICVNLPITKKLQIYGYRKLVLRSFIAHILQQEGFVKRKLHEFRILAYFHEKCFSLNLRKSIQRSQINFLSSSGPATYSCVVAMKTISQGSFMARDNLPADM